MKRIKVKEHMRTKPKRNASGRFVGAKSKKPKGPKIKAPKRGQLALL